MPLGIYTYNTDHNSNILDILCDYIDDEFTDFSHLKSIKFGYNMKKP